MLSPSQDCHSRDAPLKMEGKATDTTISAPELSWQLQGGMLSSVRNTVILQCSEEWHPVCHNCSQEFTPGDWPNLK